MKNSIFIKIIFIIKRVTIATPILKKLNLILNHIIINFLNKYLISSLLNFVKLLKMLEKIISFISLFELSNPTLNLALTFDDIRVSILLLPK